MADLDKFLPYVLPNADGCPIPAAEQAIMSAAIEFCERSHAWNARLDPIAVDALTAEVDIDVEAGSAVETIITAEFAGKEIQPKSEADLIEILGEGWRERTGTVTNFFLIGNAMRLVLIPADAGSLVVRAAYRPLRSSNVLPDVLFEEHVEAIASGALAKLYATPNKPFSNPGLIEFHTRMMLDQATDARSKVYRDSVKSPLRSTPCP